ncbi:hypothetical protein E2562_005572 [Oryza meyeriana var. granulata]|uniref:Uncharacterized protein n=1 Tax=Oryza meyeriana var. granulata TaxID=110450 RepID=A0A6G1F3W7_9ORYZ|nr:hypothetical protein E2562_005572 [Oryza meyeriana var. granulata]
MRSRFGREPEEVTVAEEELGRGHHHSLPPSYLRRRQAASVELKTRPLQGAAASIAVVGSVDSDPTSPRPDPVSPRPDMASSAVMPR